MRLELAKVYFQGHISNNIDTSRSNFTSRVLFRHSGIKLKSSCLKSLYSKK